MAEARNILVQLFEACTLPEMLKNMAQWIDEADPIIWNVIIEKDNEQGIWQGLCYFYFHSSQLVEPDKLSK